MPHLLLIALIALALAVMMLAVLSVWISGQLLYPPRQPLTRTPKSCGLSYEDVTIQSRDGLSLKGWWIPASHPAGPDGQAPTVILLHPMFGNRHGYSGKPPRRPRT